MYIKTGSALGYNYSGTTANQSGTTETEQAKSLANSLTSIISSGEKSSVFDSVQLSAEAIAALKESNPDILEQFGVDSSALEDIQNNALKNYFQITEYVEQPESIEDIGYRAYLEAIQGEQSDGSLSEIYKQIADSNKTAAESFNSFESSYGLINLLK